MDKPLTGKTGLRDFYQKDYYVLKTDERESSTARNNF